MKNFSDYPALPSASPSSLSSSSSPNSSQSNSLSFKKTSNKNTNSTKLTISNNDSDETHHDNNILSSESILLDMYNNNNNNNNQLDSSPISFAGGHHQERGIDCPDYFVPEVKQKPCFPPLLLQPAAAVVAVDPMSVFSGTKQQVKKVDGNNAGVKKKSSKSAKAKGKEASKREKSQPKHENNSEAVNTSRANLLQEASQDSFVADVVSILLHLSFETVITFECCSYF